MKKKLLILSAAVGGGHKTAAHALLETCRIARPELDPVWLDSFDYCPRFYCRAYHGTYQLLADHLPHLYGWCYDAGDRDKRKMRRSVVLNFFDRCLLRRFKRRIEQEKPTHILCTHFQPVAAVEALRKAGRLDAQVGVVGCDFYLHSFWEAPGADFFCVATEEIKEIFIERGFDPARVHVTGIPVAPEFSRETDRAQARRNLGLHDDSPVVLTMASGWQKVGSEDIVLALIESGVDMQILAVAGKNESALERLQALETPPGVDLHAFGFVNNIAEMMSAGDLLVAKAGGLTMVEALAKSLPIIAMNPVPGQEVHNAHYLMERGAGLMALNRVSLKVKLREVLGENGRAEFMRERARAAGCPGAAFDIVELIARM